MLANRQIGMQAGRLVGKRPGCWQRPLFLGPSLDLWMKMMIILPASLSVSVCLSIVRVGKKGFGGLPSLAVWARAAAGHRVLAIRRIIHVVLLSSL